MNFRERLQALNDEKRIIHEGVEQQMISKAYKE